MSVSSHPDRQKEKVVAAIIAGIAACIDEEETARGAMTPRRRPALAANLWPVLGREEIMRMRTMWQRRMV
jgi:hypothetical protein